MHTDRSTGRINQGDQKLDMGCPQYCVLRVCGLSGPHEASFAQVAHLDVFLGGRK